MCSSIVGTPTIDDLERRYPPRVLPEGAEVVRVAPSPTGKPHIGTALQAIVDYALARKTGGVFILRIEDTDRERLVPGAIDEIVDAMHWLGVSPDEGPGADGRYGPYLESERLEIYRAVADELVGRGRAYSCYCSPERLAALREQQQAAGQPPRYDRRCRGLSEEERRAREEAGEPKVIRLAMPLQGVITFDDPARGRIEFAAAEQDDLVLLKSDGYPTYHLAAITDDHFMRVTTMVRGEEWISSTPKHLVLYEAMGWDVSTIVHTPLLRDPQRRKLGKRFGDTSIAWFRAQGYLPEALRNFITRVIWPHPEGRDVYPYEDFIRGVEPEALPKTGPVADPGLLDFISGEYLRRLDPPNLYETTLGWLGWLLRDAQGGVAFEVAEKQGRVQQPVTADELTAFYRAFTANREYTERVLGLEPERYRKLGDIVLQTRLYYPDLFVPPGRELLLKQVKGNVVLATRVLGDYLAAHDQSLTEDEWQHGVYELARTMEIKPGVAFMLLRVAITGAERTPPLYPIIQVLGECEVRLRLRVSLDIIG